MQIVHTRNALSKACSLWSQNGKKWAFVPTMGALHEGHLTLVREAKKQFEIVVVSIFVNPTQFDRQDDLDKYPRQPDQDTQLLRQVGVDLVFMPTVEAVYPRGTALTRIADLNNLDKRYEGASRPGHFDGVVQVVRILVNLVRPTVMFMGQKDAQQVAVLRRAALQEFWPVEIRSVSIVRNSDGLAMSSRNMQLSEEGLEKAAFIYRCLAKAHVEWEHGVSAKEISEAGLNKLTQHGFKPEYFDLVDASTFIRLEDQTIYSIGEIKPLLIVVAWLEGVRLIDNSRLWLPLSMEI